MLTSVAACAAQQKKTEVKNDEGATAASTSVVLAADRIDQYVPLLKGKRIALLSNQTGITSKGKHVLDVMLELADSGQTMLIVTHEMQFARAIADQVILLEYGGIVERSDNAERFFTNPTTERAKQFLHTFEFDRHRRSAD